MGQYSTFIANNEKRQLIDNQIMVHLSRYDKDGVFPVVVIADGAKTIRKRLQNLLGTTLIFILDRAANRWYHLSEKIWQYMAQIALNKTEKEIHAPLLLNFLWQGKTNEAMAYLQTMTTKNVVKKEELISYLKKHKNEIIQYDKRQKAGKKIGSGGVEKANDIIVAHRQKKKAMAWSKEGSTALAVLKTLEINNQWNKFWQNAA